MNKELQKALKNISELDFRLLEIRMDIALQVRTLAKQYGIKGWKEFSNGCRIPEKDIRLIIIVAFDLSLKDIAKISDFRYRLELKDIKVDTAVKLVDA